MAIVSNSIARAYSLFGLTLTSQIQLPAPAYTSAVPAPDGKIEWDRVPDGLEQPIVATQYVEIDAQRWLLRAQEMAGARFLVSNGESIRVERTKIPNQATSVALRQFLLGSCMGAIQLQRGRVPLHGNTIANEDGALLIAGAIGAGKSTLTMALLRQGYQLVADDLSVLSQVPGRETTVAPGIPRIKLWRDTCELFGVRWSELPRVHPQLDKYLVPLEPHSDSNAGPLRAIVLLVAAPINRPTIEEFGGMRKLIELQAHLYKIGLDQARRVWPWIFGALATLADSTPIYLLRRPAGGFHPAALVDLIHTEIHP